MATINRGYTFGAAEQVTNSKLHLLVDDATITGIVNSDIDASAGIATTKLAAIDGSKLDDLQNIPAGSGAVPVVNGGTGVTDGLATCVKLTGNQTIAGVKTFSSQTAMTQGIDNQNKQITGLCIENRTDDTGCTQTGRIWLRTDL